MELSKQEMELFPLIPGLWSKNAFYNIFSSFHIYQGVQNWVSKQEMEQMIKKQLLQHFLHIY